MNKTNSLGFCFLQIANPKQNVDEGMFTDNTHQRLSVAANAGIILTQAGIIRHESIVWVREEKE